MKLPDPLSTAHAVHTCLCACMPLTCMCLQQFSSDVISEHSRRASSSGRNDLFSPEGFVSLCRHVRPSLSKDDVGLLSRWLEKSSKLSIYLDEIDNEVRMIFA